MNNVFNISRFKKLAAREFDIYRMSFFWLLVMGLGAFVLCVVAGLLAGNSSQIHLSFDVCGKVVVVIAPLMFFKNKNRINSIFEFTLPASSTEKFLVKLLFCVVLTPLFVLAVLLLISGLFMLIPNQHYQGVSILESLQSIRFENFFELITFQSFFLVGTFYFRKNVFIKVCFVLIVYLIVLMGVFMASHIDIQNMAYHVGHSFSINADTIAIGGSGKNNVQLLIANILAPFGLWVVSFLKLRETEV